MNKSNDILESIDHKSGMTVPDGYFEAFAANMIASLPHRDEAESPEAIILPSPTLWSRIRPYVYLAAMFAGVWCMLKMFTLMSSTNDTNAIIDRNPILAEALSSDIFLDEYVIDDINQWDLLDEMIEDGFDAASLGVDDSDDFSSGDYNFIDPATNASAEI